MSTTPTILNFDPSVLLSYYQAKQSMTTASLPAAAASTSATATSTASATAGDTPPWSESPPSQQAEDAQVLGLTNFIDTSQVPKLSGSSTDSKTEQDNQNLFALYTAVNSLSYLTSMSQRDGMTAGQLTGFNTRFQTGLQQVESFIGATQFNNFTLQAAASSASVTSTVSVPFATSGYSGGTIVSDADIADALPGVSASDSLTISVTKGGTTTDVPIDLSQVQGPLSIDNIVAYVNQQLSTDGFSTRFKRVMTQGSISDPSKASYGIQIATTSSENVTLSSSAATPALYAVGISGNATATASAAADNQGRLVKLTNLDDPQSVFNATAKPTSGTTTAQSSVVDGNGNIYVVGNATGDFDTQLGAGSQDVYLTKYDSAGNQQWTELLGSAGTASAYSLAVDPTGGVVVAGATNADLSTTAVANGNNDSFVAKYDANGNQTWTTQIQTLANNQANAVSVDASGNVYIGGQVSGVIGAGQTNAGAADAYVAKLNGTGKLVYEQQLGTAGNDTVAATAVTAAGDLMVASVQNGHAILSKYAGGDATAAPSWQVDLGDLGGGTIAGLTVSGDQVYVSGTTQNTALDAGGAATVVNPSSGGSDAFVFSATDQGTSAAPNYVSYVGTSGTDKAGAVTVGADGTVYLAGTTTGTFAGQTRNVAGVNNMFVAALAPDGSIDWTRQYGGADGQSTGQGIAFDPNGSSVLDALGLPRGTIDDNSATSLASQTTLRAGDSFKVEIQGSAARSFTVTIAKGETLQSLVTKINGELGANGKASVNFVSGGEGLKIQVSAGVTATLVAGPKDFDALSRLGLAAGTLSAASASGSSSTSSGSTAASQVFGLGLSNSMDISTAAGAKSASSRLQAVLSAIRNAYRTTNTPASSTAGATPASSGTVPAYLQTQLSNYNLALSMLTSSTSSSSSTSGSTSLFG